MKSLGLIAAAGLLSMFATGASAQSVDFATAVHNLARTPGSGVQAKGAQQPLAYAPSQQPAAQPMYTPGATLFDRAIQQPAHKGGRRSSRRAPKAGPSRFQATIKRAAPVAPSPVASVEKPKPLPKLPDGYQAPAVELDKSTSEATRYF